MSKNFTGVYRHSLDSKGRLVVPSKFRDKLGGSFMLGRGFDECLIIYTMEEWDVFADKLNALPSNDPDARRLVRYFFNGTLEIEIDSNGRALLPKELLDECKECGIDKEHKNVVFAGHGKRAELWAEAKYDAAFAPEDAAAQRAEINEIAKKFNLSGISL